MGGFFPLSLYTYYYITPKKWTVDTMYPGKSDKAIAEQSAHFFNSISQEFNQLPRPTMGKSSTVKPPEMHETASKLRRMRKPKSQLKVTLILD